MPSPAPGPSRSGRWCRSALGVLLLPGRVWTTETSFALSSGVEKKGEARKARESALEDQYESNGEAWPREDDDDEADKRDMEGESGVGWWIDEEEERTPSSKGSGDRLRNWRELVM